MDSPSTTTPTPKLTMFTPAFRRNLWSIRGVILTLTLVMLGLDIFFTISMQNYLDDPIQGHFTVHSALSFRGGLLACDTVFIFVYGALIIAGLVNYIQQRKQIQDLENSTTPIGSTPEEAAAVALAKEPFLIYRTDLNRGRHTLGQLIALPFLLVLIALDFVPYRQILDSTYRTIGPVQYYRLEEDSKTESRWEEFIGMDYDRIGYVELYFCDTGFYRDDPGVFHFFGMEGVMCRTLRARTGLALVVLVLAVIDQRLGKKIWLEQEAVKKKATQEHELAIYQQAQQP